MRRWRATGVEGDRLGNKQRIAETKQRATAARAEGREEPSPRPHSSTNTLNRPGITTARSKQWCAMQVHRVRDSHGL